MLDYSQYGQALLLERLINEDTPDSLIDLGAHDGLYGSNSRTLLERGWRGLMIEPLPQVFQALKQNLAHLPKVELVQAACSDQTGIARLRIGIDGLLGQMSSLSSDPLLSSNLAEQSIQVQITTLPDLISKHRIPQDFGILLVDTEGWDYAVLQGLQDTSARPRIIVTEDFTPTNDVKFRLLAGLGYHHAGSWRGDSFWTSSAGKRGPADFAPPVHRISRRWKPSGRHAGAGVSRLDIAESFENTIIGWAWNVRDAEPPPIVFLALKSIETGTSAVFRAWRTPRPDVVAYFDSNCLLFSGIRAHVDVAPGIYEATVIQETEESYTATPVGVVGLPIASSARVDPG